MSKRHKPQPKRARKGAVTNATQNGLGDALGFGGGFGANAFGLPGTPGGGGSPEQVSDTTTLFTNLRWYLVSNFRQLLSELYVEIGLIQTVVDVPVDDGLRGGVEIKTKELDENEIKELKDSIERDDDMSVLAQAAKWNRLFGGAGVLVIVGDQDPEQPLNLASINKDTELEFRAVDMWELFWDKQNTDGYDPAIQTEEFEFYSYYAEKVHKSRVMKLKGLQAPSFIRPRLRGWGFSIVEATVRSINQYLKSTDLTFEVLDEFKIDVYKVKNLVSTLLGPNGTSRVKERIQMANWQKNYQHAIVMDGEDDYIQKQLSFTGLAEAQKGIRQQVAADLRMPITKLFGSSDSTNAMGSADQNDMENYNSMVESQVRNKLKYDILRIIEIKCQKLFGFIPDDLEIEFKPLRVLSAEQEENVKEKKFARLEAAAGRGAISNEEYRDACNKGNLFDIKLDTSKDGVDVDDLSQGDDAAEGAHNPKDKTDTVDPGANREDSRSPRAPVELSDKTGEKVKANSAEYYQGTLNEHLAFHGNDDFYRQNSIMTFSDWDRLKRFFNSPAFDKASYEADGGDTWISDKRKDHFTDPDVQDPALWERSKQASHKALGEERWQFVTWFYKKQGGRFGEPGLA